MDANGNHDELASVASDPVPPRLEEKRKGALHPHVFPSASQMKETIKNDLVRQPYDVSKYYHNTGFTRWVATHPKFDQLTLVVIALNALWIFIDTDYNPGAMLATSPPFFQIVENLFCMYFSFEWTMRFCAFKRKRDGIKDYWFVFDSMLVGTMFFETWIMTAILLFGNGPSGGNGNVSILRIARLLRLSRMARMARLLRAMPELLILCKGMLAAMRSVGFTLSLLFVILYVFGIAFVQLCDATPCQEIFPDVPNSMHTLLLQAALMDNLGDLVEPLQNQNLVLLLVLYLFVLLASLTVMNMLIGVICELVSIVAQTEKESIALNFVWEKVTELMNEANCDTDNDGSISKQEFIALLGNPKAIKILHDTGVDVLGLVDLAEEIFEGDEDDPFEIEKSLTFEELMENILEQRGGNTATVKDIQRMRRHFNGRLNTLEKKLRSTAMIGGPSEALGSSVRMETQSGVAQCETVRSLASIGPYIPRIEATPRLHGGFQDVYHSMQGLLAAHENEVAFLQAENFRLQDQMAKLVDKTSNDAVAAASDLAERCCSSPVLATSVSPRISPLETNSVSGFVAPEAPSLANEVPHRHVKGSGMTRGHGAFANGTAPSGQSRDSSLGFSSSRIRS